MQHHLGSVQLDHSTLFRDQSSSTRHLLVKEPFIVWFMMIVPGAAQGLVPTCSFPQFVIRLAAVGKAGDSAGKVSDLEAGSLAAAHRS